MILQESSHSLPPNDCKAAPGLLSRHFEAKLPRRAVIAPRRASFGNSCLSSFILSWNRLCGAYIDAKAISSAMKEFDPYPDINDAIKLVDMWMTYAWSRFGSTARRVFDSMTDRNTVTWNSLISGYVQNREIASARKLFDEMPERDVVSWNLMISGYMACRGSREMGDGRMLMPERDSASVSALVSGLIHNGRLNEAAEILENFRTVCGGEQELVDAYNTLIAGYGQSGNVEEATRLFDQIPYRPDFRKGDLKFRRNVVSWNSMIMCYTKVGDLISARQLFDEMDERDIVSWNTMISGYVQCSNLEEASNLFCMMSEPDSRSWNSMISGYAHQGKLDLALDFFNRMPERRLVSWNTMIAGYEQNGDYEEAIRLFCQMQREGEKPDKHTLSSVLSACAGLAALNQGKAIHQRVLKTVIADTPISNSLITMYSRCGVLGEALVVFNEVKMQRDVISWNAIIGGHAYQGFGVEALTLYKEMRRLKVRPTYITFILVLSACAHAGLVDEGLRQFKSMVSEFGIEPQVEHFASLVDLLGRNGYLQEAMDLIDTMPVEPDRAVWGALLGACRVHDNVELAITAAKALTRLEPESSAPYVLLYNMLADGGRWDEAIEVRTMMERNGVKKQPGYSWIELNDKVHVFVAADASHPLSTEIHALIECCDRVIKDLFYATENVLCFNNIDL
ncbi:hypothetical protein Syun_015136 [Stephania yunnanensis]|uniref:Pentatricopeptide repeat-containing protein n=1 Tax=Stephania yunnanensis TaxID=152371 RepID=A0AAP0PCJ3_9MAGN